MRFTSTVVCNVRSGIGSFLLTAGALLSVNSGAQAGAVLDMKYQTGPDTCGENIFGTSGNDRLDGSKSSCNENIMGYGGHDILIGGKGINILNGGQGHDKLIGGKGTATFVFSRAADSSVDDPDIIVDFKEQGKPPDRIDLSDVGEKARVKLRFIGGSEFTGKPGEVKYGIAQAWECKKNGWCGDVYITLVKVDLTGDGQADFQVDLSGGHILTKDNFILRRTQNPNA
jgi:Peptidase M10 serralysin C terminal